MDDARLANPQEEVDEILGTLQEGLQRAEQAMVSLLQGLVDESMVRLSELEAALSDAEAALPDADVDAPSPQTSTVEARRVARAVPTSR